MTGGVIGNGPPPPTQKEGIDPNAVKKHGEAGWINQYRSVGIIAVALVGFILVVWLGLPLALTFFPNPFASSAKSASSSGQVTPSRKIEVYWKDEPSPPPPPPEEPSIAVQATPPQEPPTAASIVATERETDPDPKIDTTHQPDEPKVVHTLDGVWEPKKPGFGPISKQAKVIGEAVKDDDYAKNALMDERWNGCVIQPGYVLSANLITAINSEVPGEAILELREPYYSPDDPFAAEPLLPAGTRFVVSYSRDQGSAGTKLGHTRIALKVTTATMPHWWRPRRLKLEDKRIAVLSGDGSMGLGGEVDQNLFDTFLYGGIMALIDSSTRTATDEESLAGRMRGSAAERYGDIGRDYVERTFEVGPTIKIKAGERALLLFSDGVLASDRCSR